jgi:hypothetical protein
MVFHSAGATLGTGGGKSLTANMDSAGNDGVSDQESAVLVAEGAMRGINSGRHSEIEGGRRWRLGAEEVAR